jgi:hypothetical protein
MSIRNEEKGKRSYYNSWITDKPIEADRVKHLADCGRTGGVRARWKIEFVVFCMKTGRLSSCSSGGDEPDG